MIQPQWVFRCNWRSDKSGENIWKKKRKWLFIDAVRIRKPQRSTKPIERRRGVLEECTHGKDVISAIFCTSPFSLTRDSLTNQVLHQKKKKRRRKPQDEGENNVQKKKNWRERRGEKSEKEEFQSLWNLSSRSELNGRKRSRLKEKQT